MNSKQSSGWSHFQLLLLALLLLMASCVFHLKNALSGMPVYRDQHLGAAVEYSRTGINLLKPVIIGFNATGTPTPQEFPVWQALAGLAFKILGPWYGWANVVSLVLFCTCLFPLFGLAQMFLGKRGALWTLIFFLAQPLIFIYAGDAGTDGFSLIATIWFLYFGIKLVHSPRVVWWILACLAGALAAVSKLPFFMEAALTCFFVLLLRHRNSLRAWIYLASVGAVICVLFFMWTRYTDRCIAQAEFPFVDLRVSNAGSAFWYFGDWHYRLSPGNWLKGGWRVITTCFGSFALMGLVLYALCFIRQSFLASLILFSGFLTTLVFTHLILHHSHYYLMFTPAFALLCAVTALEWEKKLTLGSAWKSNILLGLVAIVLGLSLVQGMIGMKIVLHFDPFPYDMAAVVDKYCAKSDKLLIEGGGWGGNVLMLADRQGMSIWNTQFLETPETFKRLKQLGYNKLVMISDSPLLTSLQQINPGQSKFPRQSYRKFLTSVADNWPTVFQDEDILIKEIP